MKITLENANKAVHYICGAKAEDWLNDATVANRTARRKMILDDYMWNSHSLSGIAHLNTVLTYLSELSPDSNA